MNNYLVCSDFSTIFVFDCREEGLRVVVLLYKGKPMVWILLVGGNVNVGYSSMYP